MARNKKKSKSQRQLRTARTKRKQSSRSPRGLSERQQNERVKCLAAIHRVRRGEAKTVSAAARAEGTTLRAIRTLIPNAIKQDRPRARIRVKPSDRYSAKVQILANEGALMTVARGSRERDLAGQHRATYMEVLRGKRRASALEQFRGKKVGGHELLSDYERLRMLAKAGVLGQLDTLYVSAGGGR